MERNDLGGDPGANTGQTNANEFSGSTPAQQPTNNFDFAGSTGTTEQSQSIRDRATHAIGTARERLADVGSTVRERAGSAKDKLADALESGAERLRSQAGGTATLAGVGADGSTTTSVPTDGRLAQVETRLASGMQASADWLRDADLDGLRDGIERQVKEHPGRTLLIAAGLGYLIGRAFRNNQ